MKIVPLKEEHLEDAARLVSNSYRRLLERESHLPYRYSEIENLLPLLQGILKATGNGVAAIQGGCLAGFLSGWHMPIFRGKRSVYSPEWANAADSEDSAHIYEEMYSRIAADWLAGQYVAHYISLFPNDFIALRAWNWMGFGMLAVDAIRGLDPIRDNIVGVDIRRAEPRDIEQVMGLQDALWQYMKASPIFLLSKKRDRTYYEEWLGSPNKIVWLAYSRDEPVAFMRLGPADDDVCTIILDKKTTSIYAAFTKEKTRSTGMATALLDHALKSARASGYERCAVSFEPMNLLGTRFWLKNFKPVCYSIVRYIDERLVEA